MALLIYKYLPHIHAWSTISFFLFFSCPYFRNEIGGEIDRTVALSRGGGGNSSLSKRDQHQPIEQSSSQHTPRSARGFCLLDTPDSYWKNGYCPYDLSAVQESNVGVGVGKYVIERIDFGSAFYKNHFYGQGEFWLIFPFHSSQGAERSLTFQSTA